jgi:hypothetical protein
MSRKRYDVSTLEQFVGQELGVSGWLTVDQERILALLINGGMIREHRGRQATIVSGRRTCVTTPP